MNFEIDVSNCWMGLPFGPVVAAAYNLMNGSLRFSFSFRLLIWIFFFFYLIIFFRLQNDEVVTNTIIRQVFQQSSRKLHKISSKKTSKQPQKSFAFEILNPYLPTKKNPLNLFILMHNFLITFLN